MSDGPDLDEELRLLQERLLSTEPLHPDLVPYMEEGVAGIGKVLRHPLVYSVPFWSNGHVNYVYNIKKQNLEEALAEERWSSYVFIHERPYRLQAFLEVADKMDDEDFWAGVQMIWTDSENIHQNMSQWSKVWASERPGREEITDERGVAALAQLDGTVTIYRGCLEGFNEEGYSWTLNQERALWFAKRLMNPDAPPLVITATIPKDKILACIMSRGEDEIVARPEDIDVIEYEEVS